MKTKQNYEILSLIFGALSIIPVLRSSVSAILAVVALVFYSISKQKKSPLAIAGLALGIIGIVWSLSSFFR